MADARTWPECGAELIPRALDGRCPKSIGMVTFGLDSNDEPVTSPAGSEPASAPAEPEGPSATVPASVPASEKVGDRIDRYELLRLSPQRTGPVRSARLTESSTDARAYGHQDGPAQMTVASCSGRPSSRPRPGWAGEQ